MSAGGRTAVTFNLRSDSLRVALKLRHNDKFSFMIHEKNTLRFSMQATFLVQAN